MPENILPANTLKLMLLALMVIQNSSVVLVGRYTRASVRTEDAFVVNQFVLVTELCKLFGSAILEFQVTKGLLVESINEHIVKRPRDFFKISVPALLYLIQNTLLYYGLSNLSAPVFQVTYQSKLVTTAIVSVLLLNRRYKIRQWICLVALGIGVAIVILGEASQKGSNTSRRLAVQLKNEQNFGLGLLAVAVSCVSSALAGVYFEKILKKPVASKTSSPLPSLWMRNIQLAFFSICIAYGRMITTVGDKPFLFGFTKWVWLLVGLQAGGGLLVAAVIKYADNVLKGLATGVAVVVNTLLSMTFFDTKLTVQFTVGATMILSSVYFFSNEFPCQVKKSENPNVLPS